MAVYTINKIVEDTGLTRFMVLKHINGGILKCEKVSSGYEIDEDTYIDRKKNIPDVDNIEGQCEFSNYVEDAYINNNLGEDDYQEKSIKRNMYDIVKTIKVKKNSKLTFADFFSGAGGISCGFAAAGYRPIMFVDNFKEASQTYRNYFEKKGFSFSQKEDCLDITEDSTKKEVIKQLKKEHPYVICGGFPCQGFSLSGTSIATDKRNTLYQDMLEIVKEVKPEFIVMENVTGILSMLKGNVIRKILYDYNNIGYNITWKVLDSADYGVPQHRKRVIFIGNRIGEKNVFPKAFRDENSYMTVKEAIGRFEELDDDPLINHIMSKHSEDMKQRLINVKEGETLYENFNDSWKKCAADKPSCTIKENHGATNIHYKLPRVITPREMAALQSFPDDYIFSGPKTKQIKQIGNAVPPVLAQAIAYALKPSVKRIVEEKEKL